VGPPHAFAAYEQHADHSVEKNSQLQGIGIRMCHSPPSDSLPSGNARNAKRSSAV
jgi:hypothetical protein